ncbi:hypothetical protein QE429_000867 [Bacillus sp. SORGH_AS 510]|uniref:hypothetical protein n=1 Tax=Bacillus sp. SORGH_AS_0510 TaxID=3041771 RepID=UPI00277E857B|nr:hypothetical protein [Bacillus sp. SORGH_AS_0510]MDQ1144040.1 hypothetical protein [Bacillus sp. SORGH_AS_0510]
MDHQKDILENFLDDKNLERNPLFKEFCQYKEKGLRKEAFKSLDTFLNETKDWNAVKKRAFISWLFGWFEKSDDIHHVLVHPLEEKLLKPTLNDWMVEDSEDPKLFRWSGLFLKTDDHLTHLEKALELGGKREQRVLEEIINYYIYSIEFSFHHINEDAYLGEIHEDQEILLKIDCLSTKVEDTQSKENIRQTVTYYKNLLNDWMEFSSQGKEGFVQWCTENGKDYGWTNSYYY